MEEKMKRTESSSEIILLNAAKAIDDLDKIRISLGAEDFDMLTLCGPYTMPLCAAFYSLIGLAGTALGFIEIPEGATKKLVKGSPLDDDYFSMERDEFSTHEMKLQISHSFCTKIPPPSNLWKDKGRYRNNAEEIM